MKKNITSPHDRFFKNMMADPRVVKDFFKEYLPVKYQEIINLEKIVLQKEGYVDQDLKLKMIDLLYLTEFNNQEGYVSILIEHQSQPERILPFRILRYMISVMEHHLKTYKDLPVVLPLILYTGRRSYEYSTCFFDLFKERDLVKDIFLNPFKLIDLSKIPDEKLKKHLWTGVFTRVMKHIHDEDFLPALKALIPELEIISLSGYNGETFIETVLSYVMTSSETSDKKEYIKTIESELSKGEKLMTTIAQDFIEQGMQKGILQGMQQGMQQGIQQGVQKGLNEGYQKGKAETLMNVALKLFKTGINPIQITNVTGLPYDDLIKAIKEINKKDND
jgi:predicted transposase/invertase (TIGR01784 family)